MLFWVETDSLGMVCAALYLTFFLSHSAMFSYRTKPDLGMSAPGFTGHSILTFGIIENAGMAVGVVMWGL